MQIPQGDISWKTVLPAGNGIVASANKRVGLVFSAPQSNRVTVTTETVPVLDQGFSLYPGNPPFYLNALTYGYLTARPFFAIAALASQNIGIIEVLAVDG